MLWNSGVNNRKVLDEETVSESNSELEAAPGKPSAKYRPTRLVVDAALRRLGKEQTRQSQNYKYLR